MPSLERLYDQVHNLKGLVHPIWGSTFQFMDEASAVALAYDIVNCIAASGIKTVVVAETGTAPLAEICEKMAKRLGLALKFRYVNFPRERITNLASVFKHFLSDEERNEVPRQPVIFNDVQINCASRENALDLICKNMPENFYETGPANVMALLDGIGASPCTPFQLAVSQIFKGTSIADDLATEFIYLDEYIDAGITLRNAIAFFRCFTPQPNFKTVSYYLSEPRARFQKNVLYVCFTRNDKPDCYERGAYAYENRIDLIGHFYLMRNERYERIEVASIADRFWPNEQSWDPLIARLMLEVSQQQLTKRVREAFAEEQIKQFVTHNHVMRYCLWQLEHNLGAPEYAEFLFQMFDMYGPAWSPMPTAFHFDFWNGFRSLAPTLRDWSQDASIAATYQSCRTAILGRIAELCTERRVQWMHQIDIELEKAHPQSHGQAAVQKRTSDSTYVEQTFFQINDGAGIRS